MPAGASASILRQGDIAFYFSVTIDGLSGLGDFMSVEHISRQIEPLVYQEGGRIHGPHSLYNPPGPSELVLRWGLMDRSSLYDWMDSVRFGLLFRKSGAIYQYPRLAGGAPLRLYSFQGAWPISWRGPKLDAMSSEVPIEELRLAVDFLTMEVTGA